MSLAVGRSRRERLVVGPKIERVAIACECFLSPLRMARGYFAGEYDHLADGPQCKPGKLEVRPCKRKTNDGDAKDDCGQHVDKGEPPTREHQPDNIADLAEKTGTGIPPPV